MIQLTTQQLAAAVQTSVPAAQSWTPYINATLKQFEIGETKARVAAFLAQTGWESGGFRLVHEIWGPTPTQALYERDWGDQASQRPPAMWPPTLHTDRNWKAYELGNINPGDGMRYRGRGLIEVTGRTNYAIATKKLRLIFGPRVPDFEAQPELLELMEWASHSAGEFWQRHGLNALSDQGRFELITRSINPGMAAQPRRVARLEIVEKVLA